MTDDPVPRRHVAIISYFFPPLGGVGVQRVLKHATYLPRFGWQPVVFTPRNPAYEITDPDLQEAVPEGLEVRRSFIVEPRHIYGWLVGIAAGGRRIRDRIGRRNATGSAPASDGLAAPADAKRRDTDRRFRLLAAIRSLVFFPDEQVAWIPFAVRSVRASAHPRRFDAVLSSSPPVTTHLIAGLARRSGATWIADFRDPWLGNGFAPAPPWFQRKLMERIERWIVHRADRSVFTTTRMRAAYAARYPDVADRFVTITNGYDRRDLAGFAGPPRSSPGTFRIVYAGSLYGERELAIFLEGLTLALARHPELRDIVRVEFVGWLSRPNQALAAAASRSEALAGIVTFDGFSPRRDALARVASADAGLLVLCDRPGRDLIVPVKLFEYLGLDRQVLAIVPDGAVRDALIELDWGVVVPPDPAEIARGIHRVITEPHPNRSADPAGRYERETLAAQLASLLATTQQRGAETPPGH